MNPTTTPSPAPAARRVDVLVLCAAAVIALLMMLFSEAISAHGGLGYDGDYFAHWVRHFDISTMDSYSIQRMLPAAVVRVAFRILGIEPTDQHLVAAFRALNFALIVSMVFLWTRVAAELNVSASGMWLGYAALALNFFSLKWAFYYPMIGDTCAYASGIFMLYFYLKRNGIGLVAATVAFAFTWPTAVYVGGVLLAFPREPGEEEPRRAPHRLNLLAATLAAAALVGITCSSGRMSFYSEQLPHLAVLSLAASALMLAGTLTFALDDHRLFSPRVWWRRCLSLQALGALLLVVAVRAAQVAMSTGETRVSVRAFLEWNLLGGLAGPGVSMIAHMHFYGLMVAVAVLVWKWAWAEIHRAGLGATVCLAASSLLLINPESRQWANLYTLLVPFVVKAVDRAPWSSRAVVAFILLAALSSKVWFPLEPDYLAVSPKFSLNMTWPDSWYSIHASAAVLALLIAYAFLRWSRRGEKSRC